MSTTIESSDKSEIVQSRSAIAAVSTDQNEVQNVEESEVQNESNPRKRGRKSKYATDEERIEARRRQQREYRRRKKEELERLRKLVKINDNGSNGPLEDHSSKVIPSKTIPSKVIPSKVIQSTVVKEFFDDGTL